MIIGDAIPEFEVDYMSTSGKGTLSSESLRGKRTILFFYPEDFSFICPTEVTGFNDHLHEIEKMNAEIYGISTDSLQLHEKWIAELGLKYPLISDESRELSNAFGVLDPSDNRANRATFIIGPDLTIEFLMVTARNVGRSVNETIRVLRAINTGDLCPADYNPLEG